MPYGKKELDAKLDSTAIENRCAEYWEKDGVYKFNPDVAREKYFCN